MVPCRTQWRSLPDCCSSVPLYHYLRYFGNKHLGFISFSAQAGLTSWNKHAFSLEEKSDSVVPNDSSAENKMCAADSTRSSSAENHQQIPVGHESRKRQHEILIRGIFASCGNFIFKAEPPSWFQKEVITHGDAYWNRERMVATGRQSKTCWEETGFGFYNLVQIQCKKQAIWRFLRVSAWTKDLSIYSIPCIVIAAALNLIFQFNVHFWFQLDVHVQLVVPHCAVAQCQWSLLSGCSGCVLWYICDTQHQCSSSAPALGLQRIKPKMLILFFPAPPAYF